MTSAEQIKQLAEWIGAAAGTEIDERRRGYIDKILAEMDRVLNPDPFGSPLILKGILAANEDIESGRCRYLERGE